MAILKLMESSCSLTRSIGVLGERWTFLIVREALNGVARFSEFQVKLGLPTDMLSARLETLVEYGAMTREPYQDAGRRQRDAYRLTEMGRDVHVVLSALQQWGDRYLPPPGGSTCDPGGGQAERLVHVGFIDDHGAEVSPGDVTMTCVSCDSSIKRPTVSAAARTRRISVTD
jgi:DNA-binding HxlR family transcriptional regulator